MALVTFLQPLFNTQGIVPGQRATGNYILLQFLLMQFQLRKSYEFLFPLPCHNTNQSLRAFQKDACPCFTSMGDFSPMWGQHKPLPTGNWLFQFTPWGMPGDCLSHN